jgi:hypothetical protein
MSEKGKNTRASNVEALRARLAAGSTQSSERKRCAAKTRSGKPCPNWPLTGKKHCNLHDGDTARVIGAKGGRRRARYNPEKLKPIPEPKNVQDVLRALGQVFSEVHSGKVEPRIGNTLAYLASGILQALSVGNVEERIVELERRYNAMKGTL